MNDTRSLSRLYAYDTWANARVFAACQALDQAQLEAGAPGTYGSIEDTLRHMVGVAHIYSLMLRDLPRDHEAAQDAFYARDLGWHAAHAAELGVAYQGILAAADAAYLDAPLHVPWFDFALTRLDGLLQVLTHSAQHRAQVFSVLGGHGIETPNLDYVELVNEEHAAR
ncbi:MAG TPA: DinB family protein [Ktedonobacterales bacterium]